MPGRIAREVSMNPLEHQNIILAGFMGTGKSSTGKVLAKRLGWQFVDTDDLIEQEAGKSITDIFSEDGEEPFRILERHVAAGIRDIRHRVVATGGGILLDPVNRQNLENSGLLILLTADVDSIWDRIRKDAHRPLLQCEVPRSRIRELLDERSSTYDRIHYRIDTGGIPVEKVADLVFEMVKHE
jgi:shikimate kinase